MEIYIVIYFIISLIWTGWLWYSTSIPDTFKVLALGIMWPYGWVIRIAQILKNRKKD